MEKAVFALMKQAYLVEINIHPDWAKEGREGNVTANHALSPSFPRGAGCSGYDPTHILHVQSKPDNDLQGGYK